MNKKRGNQGFIALVATIIISLVLLVMAADESSSGWFARFNILGTEAKEQANALAEGCAEQALAMLLTDPTYTGNIDITSLDGTCHVFPIQLNFPTAGLVTIRTQGVVRGSYTNLDMAMEMNDLHFSSIPTAPTTGTLFITTVVRNDGMPAGTSQANNFSMSVSANPSSIFAGSESGVAVVIQPGAYSISETLILPNYTKESSGDCSGSIVGGQVKFCTITYDDVTTTLTLLANVTNNDSGTKSPTDFPLFIDGVPAVLGQAYPVSASSHTVSVTTLTNYVASPWGYDCSAEGGITMLAGQNKTCVINFDDAPPPSPICAETVMMLDRTGSMRSTDLSGERVAANSLLDLYSKLKPIPPKTALGVFGAIGVGEPYMANIIQGLTNIYTGLYNAITTGLASSNGYTNLASAIDVSRTELITNGTVGKPKVLILVSDGEPNRPSGSNAQGNSGWKSPAVVTSPNEWINPLDAVSNNNVYATADDDDDDQGYRNFNFNIPSGASIQGIEVSLDAFSAVVSASAVVFSEGFGTSNSNSDAVGSGWSENGSNSSSDGTIAKAPTGSTNDTASPVGGRFALIEGNGGYICRTFNTSGVAGAELSYYWRGDTDAENNENAVIEYRTSGNCNSSSGWSTLRTYELDDGNNNVTEAWAQDTAGIVSSSNLIIRFRSNSGSKNESLRIDGVSVTGISGPSNTSCQIQARIGDSGNFSSFKTATLNGAEATYILGDTNDDWDNVTWSSTDFSDANFRLETRFNDPDSNCDASAIASLDHLQARVHYTTAQASPTEAALLAADTAKLAGVNIFTIHFGTDPSGYIGKELLANLANGNSIVTGHQNGSVADAGSGTSNSISSLSTTAVIPNQFSNPTRAFTNNSQYSTANSNGNQQGYSGFALNVPPGSTINTIDVMVEAKSSDSSGCQIGVALSSDTGASFTSMDNASINDRDNNYTLNGTTTLWGRAWTGTDFDPSKFIVRLQNIDPGSSCSNGSTLSVDTLQVTVSYTTANLENSDGDNFFVAPTSADMQGIFNYIGQQVCPALINVTPLPSPTTATITVLTQVSGGSAVPGDFTTNVSAVNPSQVFFAGNSSGVSITVDPGAYNITENAKSGYTTSIGANCSSVGAGNIVAAENRICIITNNVIPPPPPPPNLNFDPNSWHEVPTAN